MRRLTAILFSIFSAAAVMQAQTSMRVDAPNVVAADEQFNITFILEGEDSPSDFQWSQGDDFQLVWGPQEGRSTSLQIINGKRTRSSQFTYTYILMPKKAGTFTLPRATAKVKGKEISSSAVTIEVVPASSGGTGRASSSGGRQSTDNVAGIQDDDIFLRLTLSRTDVVVGEPITATLKLYQRVNIAGFEDARFPSFNGFWSQEVEAPTNIEFRRESYDNKIYNTAVLRKYVLIPQQTGTINIDPAELVCLVNIRVSSGGGASIFDGFFDDYRTIRKRVTSSSYKVNVSPLPSGAPASFGGGVGKFTISAKMSKDSLTTHEASSLIVTISGKGNVSLLEAPEVKLPLDFEAYDVKTSENTSKSSGGTSGSKIYEFPFIPRSHGDFTVEPIKYSYYDIDAGKYVTLSTGPIKLHVKKGKVQDQETGTAMASLPSVNRQGVKSLGEDVRYIHTKLPSLSPKGDFFVTSSLFWILSAAVLLAGVLVWAIFMKVAARRADIVGTKTRRATKMAMKRLKAAENYLNQNLYSAFYEELHKAVLGFISDKLNMSAAEFSKEKISENLLSGGVDGTLTDSLIGILDACEFARYSPDAGHEAMKKHYQEALDVISSIDSSMKNKKNHKASGAAAVAAVLMLSLPSVADAANDSYVDSLWTAATGFYAAGEWEDALSVFSAIDRLGLESPYLYCNIGDAYFKTADYPHAILYYERALKLDPSCSDARYNLQVVSGLVQDKIDPVPEFILKNWARSVCYTLDSNAWAWLSIVFLAITVAMVLLFLLSGTPAARKTGFSLAVVFVLITVSSFSFSVWQKNDYMRADGAIVMVPVTSVKSSPSEEVSKDLFILHEGTKVSVLDAVGDWRNIELADGRQGWIHTDDIEVI